MEVVHRAKLLKIEKLWKRIMFFLYTVNALFNFLFTLAVFEPELYFFKSSYRVHSQVSYIPVIPVRSRYRLPKFEQNIEQTNTHLRTGVAAVTGQRFSTYHVKSEKRV